MAKTNPDSYAVELKFRGQPALKAALKRLARAERMKSSEFMRNELWKVVDAKDTAAREKLIARSKA